MGEFLEIKEEDLILDFNESFLYKKKSDFEKEFFDLMRKYKLYNNRKLVEFFQDLKMIMFKYKGEFLFNRPKKNVYLIIKFKDNIYKLKLNIYFKLAKMKEELEKDKDIADTLKENGVDIDEIINRILKSKLDSILNYNIVLNLDYYLEKKKIKENNENEIKTKNE